MSTPSRKYFCPRCRAAYDADHLYCGRCGADMHRASRLNQARLEAGEEPRPTLRGVAAARAEAPIDDLALDRRAADPWIGRIVDGRYRVVDVVGRGGMGVVYRVEHQRMGKVAAMKVLHRDLAQRGEVIERFHREAEAVSRLAHPNTVQVFDFGVWSGQPYLVMELVRGLDLGSLIQRDGRLRFAQAAPLFAQICAALDEAHEVGIVHRDLKPENVLVSRTHGGDDHVKVLDFGLAKLAEREEQSEVTGRGSIVGTPYYMAPEQIRGEAVDGRTDLYSLGALMFRVLTGEPPFKARTPVGVLTKHLTEAAPAPSDRAPDAGIAPAVDALVLRALAKPPDQRYPTALALLDDLERAWREADEDSGRRPGLRGLAPLRRTTGEVDPSSDRMLRRSDLDDFERALRRRRRLGMIGLPLVAVGAAAAIYYAAVWKARQPRGAEVEPNHVAAQATPIAAGAVSGTLGQRLGPTEGDRDVYRLVTRPAAGDVLTARLSPLPNMDLELLVHDRAGQLLARIDEGGVGDGEVVHDLALAGAIDLVVQEVRGEPPRLPTENVSDRYRLTVEVGPLPAGRSGEPDDAPPEARALAVGARLSGYLDRRADVDHYRFEGPAGRYHLRIEAPPDLPIEAAWQGRAPSSEPVELAPGAILRVARTDPQRPRGQALPAADRPYSVEVIAR